MSSLICDIAQRADHIKNAVSKYNLKLKLAIGIGTSLLHIILCSYMNILDSDSFRLRNNCYFRILIYYFTVVGT